MYPKPISKQHSVHKTDDNIIAVFTPRYSVTKQTKVDAMIKPKSCTLAHTWKLCIVNMTVHIILSSTGEMNEEIKIQLHSPTPTTIPACIV